MSVRKPHNQNAGYIAEKIFKPSGAHIVIYIAKDQGIDVDGQYAVVCELHKTIVGCTSVRLARLSMKYPDFCEDCIK